MNLVAWSAAAVALGAAIGCLAHARGRSFSLWWVYGSLAGIVALPHLLLLRDLSSDRRWSPVRYGLPAHDHACPFCGMPVHEAALVCRHCRQAVDPEARRNNGYARSEQAGSAYPSRAPEPVASSDAVSDIVAQWSMAGYSGFSPIPATMSADSRRKASTTMGRRAAGSARVRPERPEGIAGSGKAPRREAATAHPDTTMTHIAGFADQPGAAGATVRAAAEPTADVTAGLGEHGPYEEIRRQRLRRSRRDMSLVLRPTTVAALVVCLGAALFVTPVWRIGTDIVQIISPATSGSSPVPDDLRVEAFSPKPAERARATNAVPAPQTPASSGAASDTQPDIPALPQTLAFTNDSTSGTGPSDKAERTVEPPHSSPQAALPRPDPTHPTVEPEPRPELRSTSAGAARYANAAPKQRPQVGFDAEAQANLDAAIERLKKRVASKSASPADQKVSRDTGISATGEVVYELQRKLKARGFDPGAIDGQFGPHTRRALEAYQRNAGMSATGEINKQVLIAFGIIS